MYNGINIPTKRRKSSNQIGVQFILVVFQCVFDTLGHATYTANVLQGV